MRQNLLERSDYNKIPIIDRNKRIEEQNISKEARIFLTMIKLNYWCNSKEEEDELIRQLKENEREYQEVLKQKYNTDNLFKKNDQQLRNNTNTIIEDKNNTQLKKVEKKGFFSKIFEHIRKFFK